MSNDSTKTYLAKTFQGLEEVLAAELQELGALNISVRRRAVLFDGDLSILYKANLKLHTALRILMPIYEFEARDEHQLYRGIQEVDWPRWMGITQTFAIDSTVKSEFFRHSKFAALKSKDALVDQFRAKYRRRPSVDTQNPDLRIHIHINHDRVRVMLDSSGESLHKRGYRQSGHRAPVNEVLAAGMIALSGWKGERSLIDPMCGSGTILIEAALWASKIGPGTLRERFGFMNWRNYDQELFNKIKLKLHQEQKPLEISLYGVELYAQYVELARDSIASVGLAEQIWVQEGDFFEIDPPAKDAILIMNPPYGERLEQDEINGFYKEIGDRFKQQYKGSEAWVLSSNLAAMKRVGLKPDRRIQLFNGPLDCRFNQFSLY
ncbi:MAG: class I SAM-dependent RNA methyltransferase [Bacteroidia bacterium]